MEETVEMVELYFMQLVESEDMENLLKVDLMEAEAEDIIHLEEMETIVVAVVEDLMEMVEIMEQEELLVEVVVTKIVVEMVFV